MRVLTTRELNRALLARQLLLAPAAVPVPVALERMGLLQAQYAPSIYIGLWSRLARFRRADLTGALEDHRVVQGTLVRSTIHAVSAADYWPTAVAIRDERRASYHRTVRNGPSAAALAEAAVKLREALADGPLRQGDIDRMFGPGFRVALGLYLDLLRVPPSGTWERRRADLYAAAEDRLGPPAVSVDDATDHLVRRYLGGFGPATVKDIANWAGLPVPTVTAALARLRTRRFAAEDGAELVDLPRAPLPDADTPAPVRLLGTWDAALLVHARRKAILPEEYRPRIFHTRIPQSLFTFLVDGAVAGTWRYDSGSNSGSKKGKIVFDEFHPQPPAVRRELAAEGERIVADLYADGPAE
jgi:hypothetical protein